MKKLIIIAVLFLATPVMAESLYFDQFPSGSYYTNNPAYEVRPKYYTPPETTGAMSHGSTLNPYTVRNRDTGENYEVAPKYNSPLLPPGSYINPYVIK